MAVSGSYGLFGHDLLDRITRVTWAGPTPIDEMLSYDLAGNISSLQREGSLASSIVYDAVDQILSSSGGSIAARSYTLDLVGNRLSDSLNGAGNFTNNFLTSNGLASFLADADGFGDTVQEIKAGVTKTYAYRADGRISGFQSGSLQVEYRYDALGRLLAKAINDGTSNYTQSFAYVDQEQTLLQAKAGNGAVTTYLEGQGVNEHLAELNGAGFKGYVTDHLGSVLNSDMAGQSHRFELFGESTGAASLNPSSDPASFGYAGGMHNRESKTTKFNWRDLNHETGRWLSQEPTGEDGPSMYWYSRNNPLRYTDPTGKGAVEFFSCIGIGYAMGTALSLSELYRIGKPVADLSFEKEALKNELNDKGDSCPAPSRRKEIKKRLRQIESEIDSRTGELILFLGQFGIRVAAIPAICTRYISPGIQVPPIINPIPGPPEA